MDERAYYADSYTAQFEGEIVETTEVEGQPAARLARTYFYPTSGGQPNDTGQLRQGERAARVVDVIVREDDDAVLHVLDAPLTTGAVAAEIDWPRRFDHMQHHTGQHILSQAFIRVAEAETVSFHLSGQSVTIDLDRADLTADEIRRAELLANEVVGQNRAVSASEVARETAATLPLRKLPPGRDGRVRLIDIDGFDLTACGGTHVGGTAEVGLIKVLKTERRGATTRVEFICGGRAVADYRQKHDVTQELSATLTTGVDELVPSLARLQEEIKQLRLELKRERTARLALEAEQLGAAAETVGGLRLARRVFVGREMDEVKQLAALLAAGGVVALLGVAGERAQLIFTRPAEGPEFARVHMGELIKPALAVLVGARGGGGPASAQGGGPPADEATVAAALAAAVARLREATNPVE
jgi:alanyl-tRNA synthetase